MTWALKRQLSYIGILILFFGIFAFLIIYPGSKETPTCFDGRQNGTETGVDCGGTCARACLFESDQVSVRWARAFEVIPSRYNAVAYLTNHNKNLSAGRVKYQFRFADKDNVYLGRREGYTYIPPGRDLVVFERGIELGNSIPVYTTFQLQEIPDWINVPEEKIEQIQISVSDINLFSPDETPRLSATVKNDSLFIIPEVSFTALLYDQFGNVVAASSTFLDELRAEEERVINFTWPLLIKEKVEIKEILPSFNIFSAKLK